MIDKRAAKEATQAIVAIMTGLIATVLVIGGGVLMALHFGLAWGLTPVVVIIMFLVWISVYRTSKRKGETE